VRTRWFCSKVRANTLRKTAYITKTKFLINHINNIEVLSVSFLFTLFYLYSNNNNNHMNNKARSISFSRFRCLVLKTYNQNLHTLKKNLIPIISLIKPNSYRLCQSHAIFFSKIVKEV